MDNMYNFDARDADDYLQTSTRDAYRLFESYIAHLYSRANIGEQLINNYDTAYYSIACAQLYPNAEWLHPGNVPDNLIHDLLIIGMVETSAGVPRFQKISYAYFFICKFLIRFWEQLEVVDNLYEDFFGPRGSYLRLFLITYLLINATFQSNLQQLLEENLFHSIQFRHGIYSKLEIMSPEQLNIDMNEYSATFGYDFPSYFIVQTDLSRLRLLLTQAFEKVGAFPFVKTDEDHIHNMGLLYAHFLNQARLQNQLNAQEARAFLQMLDSKPNFRIDFNTFDTVLNEPESLRTFLLEKCNELQYVLLCQFIKCCCPTVIVDVGNMNNIRFQRITELQVRVLGNVNYIQNNYPIRAVDLPTVLNLERYGLAISRGTMTFTRDMMYTFRYYLNIEGGWLNVYQNKVLVELILPFIHLIITGYPCDVNRQELLELLLDFSIINLKRTVEATALRSTLQFIESMIVENNDNVRYFTRFLIYLSKHNFCLIRMDNILQLINKNYVFVYNITTDADVIIANISTYREEN
ncbi:hypothetical protein CBL_02491 [Carabus blaptoides fortunei]